MGKCKCMSAKPTLHEQNYQFFQELVIEELGKMTFDPDEDWAAVRYPKCVQHVLSLKAENIDKFIDKSNEIKDLAIQNNCSNIFGCELLFKEGAQKGIYNMIVFDLEG